MKKRILRALIGVVLILALIVAGVLMAFYRAEVPLEHLQDDYTDEASRFAEIEGLNVHYKDEGSGPVLVLLHGFASSLHTWDGWVRELESDFRLIRLDLPGHGLTGPNADHDYRSMTTIAVLDQLLEELGVERFSMAGNSMGGGLSWLYAARHPEKIENLILIDAAGAPYRPGSPTSPLKRGGGSSVMGFIRLPVIKDLVPRITPRFLFKNALLEVYADDSKVTDELVDRHYDLALRAGNRAALTAKLNLVDKDHRDLIPSIEVSTLVMWGREDTWIPVSHAERFHAALPKSELIIYDDVGHLPMEEIPMRSATDARDFLGRLQDLG